jgi:predicted nucleic acid-binding protein
MLEAVVADASPLILLGRVDRLDLLRAISHEVLVPPQVVREIDVKGEGDRSLDALARASWIRGLPDVEVTPEVAAWSLGSGESAVIAAALHYRNASAIVDDRQAHRCAEALGVRSFGTIGVVTIRGMRLTVELILKLLGDGYSAEAIVRDYPEMEKEDVYQAAQYVARLGGGKIPTLL